MKYFNKYLTAITVTSGILALCWAGYLLLNWWNLRTRANAHATTHVGQQLGTFLRCIQVYIDEDKATNWMQNGALDIDVSVSNFIAYFAVNSNLVSSKILFSVRHDSRDPWGREYMMRVHLLKNASYYVKLWSLGRNGRDEKGEGDDLAVTNIFTFGRRKIESDEPAIVPGVR